MNRDEFIALAEDESRTATRRAAHLVMLLAVDNDGPTFQREVHRLAIGEDADPLFVAQVAGVSAQIAAQTFEVLGVPVEARRRFLGELMAANLPTDLRDLGAPEDPS